MASQEVGSRRNRNKEQESAVARADALLTRWEERLHRPQSPPSLPKAGQQRRATPQPLGARLLRPAARGYVWFAATVAAVATPVQKNWQQAVSEARQDQVRQETRVSNAKSARQARNEERQGEQKLKKSAGTTAEVAGTATDVATA